jgi:hypothetical protein
MLARSAYRPPERPAAETRARFEAVTAREAVDASPSVRIELSAKARIALLGLQEIGRSPPSASFSSGAPLGDVDPGTYRPPGGRLNITI